MLRIRRMRMEDVPFAVRLSEQEHWGVTRNDLQRILRLTPAGCFIAYEGTKKLGLTTTTIYGRKLAWIGNVIVDREYRGMHIGRNLVDHAVAFLKKSRIQNIALYCFKENVDFYENLGFVKDARFLRMRRKTISRAAEVNRRTFDHAPSLHALLSADKRAFGADRSRLVRDVLAKRAGWYLGSAPKKVSLSYVMIREYRDMCELGPWICINPSRNEPERMLNLALSEVGELPIELSCLQKNKDAIRLMEAHGFRTFREGYRMFFRDRARIGNDKAQYALGFLDKG